MAKFTYLARDSKGTKVTGSEEASSQDELVSRLQVRNLVVVNILPEVKVEGIAITRQAQDKQRRYRHYGVTRDDLVIFSRQLATLLGAGVTILKSLDIISKQVYSRKFYNVLQELKKHMEA
ncbi:MAG: hypothetical protein Q8R31_04685, partial [Candidatus Omnitrophota bacterium]|nr:hypothetical protein [Candidatus Omnitrophota bacterium]